MPVAPVRNSEKDLASCRADIVESVDFLPAPPGNDSTDFVRESEIYRQTRAEKGSQRWERPLSMPTPVSIKMPEQG